MRAIRRSQRRTKQQLRKLYREQAIKMLTKTLRLIAAEIRRHRRESLLAVDSRCHWCRVRLYSHTATIDHLVPSSKGGSDEPDNLVLACERCNKARGNSGVTDREEVARLVRRR